MGWEDEMDAEMKARQAVADVKRRADEARANGLDAMFTKAFESSRKAYARFAGRLADRVRFTPPAGIGDLLVSDLINHDRLAVDFKRAEERIMVYDLNPISPRVQTFKADANARFFVLEGAKPGTSGFNPSNFGEEVVGPALLEWAKSHKLLDAN